jgi:hypothetical protein
MQDSAAGPVHDVCQQDDDQNDDHQPEEEHDDSGDDVPSYSSRSSHGLQLPGAARIIRNRAWRGGAWPSAHWRPARPPGRTTHDTATLMRPAGQRPGPVIASRLTGTSSPTHHARLGVKGPVPPSDASARGVKGPLPPTIGVRGPFTPLPGRPPRRYHPGIWGWAAGLLGPGELRASGTGDNRLWAARLTIPRRIDRENGWRCPVAGSGRSSLFRAPAASPSCWRMAPGWPACGPPAGAAGLAWVRAGPVGARSA